MWLDVNGEKRQRGNTKTMIFGIQHIVWYCSQFFVLEPGDVITTGTPPGVALGMKPDPVWLKPGDTVTPRHRGPRRAEAEDRTLQGVTSVALQGHCTFVSWIQPGMNEGSCPAFFFPSRLNIREARRFLPHGSLLVDSR